MNNKPLTTSASDVVNNKPLARSAPGVVDNKPLTTSTPGFATRAIHQGYDPMTHQGALVPPLYMTSTFAFPDTGNGGDRFAGDSEGFIYGRLGNPTQSLLEERLASLEGGQAALATASGMGAITSAIWSLVEPGDHIIANKTLYGCTFAYFQHGLSKFGVRISYVDMTEPQNVAAALTDKTRIVYFETPSNPSNGLVDIAAVAEIAHSRDVSVIVDNTYCTPYLQQPLSLGADLVVHSATKYLGGHGDLVAGVIVGGDAHLEKIRTTGLKDMTGAVIAPMDAFLVMRGLKTLALRMDAHSTSAMAVAEQIAAHAAVQSVYYPGLPDFAQHDLARRQMNDFGGMIAFELKGGIENGIRFMDSLQLVARAVSLGDAESLVQHPASMTHSPYTVEERAEFGISDTLIRLSVGLETLCDIQQDIEQALDRVIASTRVSVTG